jgi:hypothetical protein
MGARPPLVLGQAEARNCARGPGGKLEWKAIAAEGNGVGRVGCGRREEGGGGGHGSCRLGWDGMERVSEMCGPRCVGLWDGNVEVGLVLLSGSRLLFPQCLMSGTMPNSTSKKAMSQASWKIRHPVSDKCSRGRHLIQ